MFYGYNRNASLMEWFFFFWESKFLRNIIQ